MEECFQGVRTRKWAKRELMNAVLHFDKGRVPVAVAAAWFSTFRNSLGLLQMWQAIRIVGTDIV